MYCIVDVSSGHEVIRTDIFGGYTSIVLPFLYISDAVERFQSEMPDRELMPALLSDVALADPCANCPAYDMWNCAMYCELSHV